MAELGSSGEEHFTSLEGKSTVPGLSPESLISVASSGPKLDMYKQLGLEENHIEFLESPNREKLLTRFEIGSEGIVMYGGLFRMSIDSELIKSIMFLDPPYTIGANIIVYGGALTILWLYLNGFEDVADAQQRLSLRGFLNLYDLINYFDVKEYSNRSGIVDDWYIYLTDRIITTPENELVEYADAIVAIFNKVAEGTALTYEKTSGEMADKLSKIDKIASKLKNIPIILYREQSGGEIGYKNLGWIDRKGAEDPERFVEFMVKAADMRPDSVGNFLHSGENYYNAANYPIRRPNSILLIKPPKLARGKYSDFYYHKISLRDRIPIPKSVLNLYNKCSSPDGSVFT